MQGALPLGQNLATRGVSGALACTRCGEPESAAHTLPFFKECVGDGPIQGCL